MKKNSFLWAALSMTAALVMTACSSDDNNMTEAPVAPSTSKTIPYTVTVGSGDATTRATVKDDPSNRELYFAAGDKLYITGTNIQGVLDLQSGDEGKASDATFSGELTYDGSGSPADNLELTATLVSAQQTDGSEVTINATTGAVTVNYPDNAYCTSVNDAVQKYSNLTGISTYSAKSFTLTQQTAFLNFEITVTGGVTGTTLPARFINNDATFALDNVTTVTDGSDVKAKFVLPVAIGTELSSATLKLGGEEITAPISNTTLSTGKVYNVKRTVSLPSVSLAGTQTTPDRAVKVKYNYSYENYCLFVSNGNGTYTFQSGGGLAGSNASMAKALVVEGGKLVFKQNFFDPIDNGWDNYGFSVTFDTGNNTCSQWVGANAKNDFNPSFISVEVNGTEISLTSAAPAAPDDPVAPAETTITWNSSNISDLSVSGIYNSYTKEDITLSANAENSAMWDDSGDKSGISFNVNGSGGFTFTAPTGKKFKKIEMTLTGPTGWESASLGTGWKYVFAFFKVTWTGTAANTVDLLTDASPFNGESNVSNVKSIVFTVY